jgi:signal transduction histidine kinase
MVINGYSALLLRELHSEDPIYEPVAQIGKAGDRAAGITRQLLAFSRQQKEDIEIDLRPGEGADDIKAEGNSRRMSLTFFKKSHSQRKALRQIREILRAARVAR